MTAVTKSDSKSNYESLAVGNLVVMLSVRGMGSGRAMLYARAYSKHFVDQSDGVIRMASDLQLGDAIAALANNMIDWGAPHTSTVPWLVPLVHNAMRTPQRAEVGIISHEDPHWSRELRGLC